MAVVGLAGQDDLYLIQPPLNSLTEGPGGRTPDCSFTNQIRQAQKQFTVPGNVHLVDHRLKYGMVNH
jgi:hypothetical protein